MHFVGGKIKKGMLRLLLKEKKKLVKKLFYFLILCVCARACVRGEVKQALQTLQDQAKLGTKVSA